MRPGLTTSRFLDRIIDNSAESIGFFAAVEAYSIDARTRILPIREEQMIIDAPRQAIAFHCRRQGPVPLGAQPLEWRRYSRLRGPVPCSCRRRFSVTHDIRWKQRFDNFQRALHQVTRAVQLRQQRPLSDLEQQGLIQGFEFTHELAWNVLKDYLEMEGIQGLAGSRSTVREAFKRGLVSDGEVWMDMIEKRSLSSHTYNQSVANAVAAAIVDRYYEAFLELQRRFVAES